MIRLLPARSCQVVYILGDYLDLEIILQPADGEVACIRFFRKQLFAPDVVKIDHQLPVFRQGFGVQTSSIRYLSHNPSASRNVESPLSALMPAPGENDDFLAHDGIDLSLQVNKIVKKRAAKRLFLVILSGSGLEPVADRQCEYSCCVRSPR